MILLNLKSMINIKSFYNFEDENISCIYIKSEKYNILINCGILHPNMPFEMFPFDPKLIDFLFLSSADIKESGLIPRLIKEGFDGEIYSTKETFELYDYIIKNAALIEKEGIQQNKHYMLYDNVSINKSLSMFSFLDKRSEVIYDDLSLQIFFSGYMPGSFSIKLMIEGKSLIILSNLCASDQHMYKKDTIKIKQGDIVVIQGYSVNDECNYKNDIMKFDNMLDKAILAEGNILFPVFSPVAIFNILSQLDKFFISKNIDNIPIFIDGLFFDKFIKFLNTHKYKYNLPIDNINYIGDSSKSLRLVQKSLSKIDKRRTVQSQVIIASGERMINYLKKNAVFKKTAIILTEATTKGTFEYEIENHTDISYKDKYYKIRANVVQCLSFSGYICYDDIMPLLNNVGINIIQMGGSDYLLERLNNANNVIEKRLSGETYILK